MKVEYAREEDILYIQLRDAKIKDSDEVAPNMIVDYDADGNAVAIEILFASRKTDIKKLICLAIENVEVCHASHP